jgi:hypothetical protein
MRTAAVTLIVLPLVVFAAPVPKRANTMEILFGNVTNPKTECKFETSRDGALTVTMPAGWDPVPPRNVAYRGPLVAKTIEGDFNVSVRLTHTLPATAWTHYRNECPGMAAGLSVWATSGPDFERAGVIAAIDRTYCAGRWVSDLRHYEGKQAQWASNSLRPELKPDAVVYLRVTRRGDIMTEEWSADGKAWAEIGKSKLVGPVSVGPVAFQCTDHDFVVTFSEYELKELPPEKK